MKGKYVLQTKTVVVKRFFGEGDANLKIVAKEARMLQDLRHPKVAEFIAVCPKPVAIMMEYECFDFLPFGLDAQVSDLRDLLHCLDRLNTLKHVIIITYDDCYLLLLLLLLLLMLFYPWSFPTFIDKKVSFPSLRKLLP